MASICTYLLTIFLFCSVFGSAKYQNNITTSSFLRDSETLVSDNGFFEMGFFNPPNSSNRYLGIWYYEKDDNGALEVVWVANRDNPLNDSSGVLKISEDGNLRVLDSQSRIFWSSNVTLSTNSSSIAQLQDTGNFVLYEDDSGSGNVIWQSFDHLTNTLLPQMEITADKMHQLTSWRSYSNPSNGHFSSGISTQNFLTEVFTWNDDHPYYRSGPWNGNVFIGIPLMNSVLPDGFNLVEDSEGKLSLSFSLPNQSTLTHKMLDSDGILNTKVWDYGNRKWQIQWTSYKSNCDIYGYCGPFGSCNSRKSPICSCLKGFEPKNEEEWSKGNWTRGCNRRTALQCGSKIGRADGFLKISHMKTPADTVWLSSEDEEVCRLQCLRNCQCLAYARHDGIGCMVWNGSLIDLQEFSADGVDLYIRLAGAELGKTSKVKIILPVLIASGAMFFAAMCFLWRWRTRRSAKKVMFPSNMNQAELQDLPLFTFEKLVNATHNFHETNKLGRGGFGPVYKGKLGDGQEIAVKRLARTSGQGLQEFMNEVVLISKLQHINLVRLLGCCVEGDEKMLVYEYMPNNSLDAFLFDPLKAKNLDWKKRFNIIEGICRGLLYLHRDSRLRVIHRDLKASNILLDEDLNPKISDFGMARIFRRNEDRANTLRVVGTYGYMSPEYAMKGLFSEKSDVFSLGVLLLEIISGESINSFDDDDCLGLVGYAWKLWNEDDILSFVDASICDPQFKVDILRCIQLALLCVQEFAEERPTISAVVYMLHCEIATLPHPKQPGFAQKRSVSLNELDQNAQYDSINHVSLTSIVAR